MGVGPGVEMRITVVQSLPAGRHAVLLCAEAPQGLVRAQDYFTLGSRQ